MRNHPLEYLILTTYSFTAFDERWVKLSDNLLDINKGNNAPKGKYTYTPSEGRKEQAFASDFL